MNRYITALLLCATFIAHAQVSITLYPLQPTQLRSGDIFRADVLNTGSAIQLYFTGTITDLQTGKKIVSARTSAITLPKGIVQLNESLLQPQYSYFSEVVEQTDNLPYGTYTICLMAFMINAIEPEAETCQETQLQPLSPPLLINPENESVIHEEYPLLVWLPPMPISKHKVLYDLKLTEIIPNQSPYDAIQRNFAVLEQSNISGTSLQYPANAIKLEPGKKYAWKVNAYTADRKPIGETEVWWFTKAAVTPGIKEEPLADRYYVILDESANKKRVVIKEQLKIISEDYINSPELQYEIIDANGNRINKGDIEVTAEGNGKFVLLFNDPKKLAENDLQLIVTTPKGRKRFITFTFIK